MYEPGSYQTNETDLTRMLYEFHKSQNDKKPGTLHATYLVYGVLSKPSQQQNVDVEMTDSQMSSQVSQLDAPFSDQVPMYTMSLVKEEQMDGKDNTWRLYCFSVILPC
jgi:hypothetical protein